MKHAAVVAEIRELCNLGLPGPELIPSVLEALHRLVPSYTNLFDWVDEHGDILDYYTEGPYAPEAARLYFDEFYNKRDREVMVSYSAQVRRVRGVVRCADPDREFCCSDFYNLIWRPRGVHRSLVAVVRHDDRPVGVLILYRGANEVPFSERDEQALAGITPYLTHAVATGADYCGRYASSGVPGLVVVDAHGHVVYVSAAGRRLLYLARRSEVDTRWQACDAQELALPEALAAWCRGPQDIPCDVPLPVLEQHNAWGKFVFRGHRLEPFDVGTRLVAIEIDRHLPVSLSIARSLRLLPLSVRQRELCRLLAEGRSYAAIAVRMNITTNTAISYARLVYDKLGVKGRDDLARMLLAPATEA